MSLLKKIFGSTEQLNSSEVSDEKDEALKLILDAEEYDQYKQVVKNKENALKKGMGFDFPGEDASFSFMARQKAEDGNFVEALKYCNAAICLNSSWEYYDLRAQIKKDTDDLEGAIEDYTTCIDMQPNEGDLYKNRAIVKIALTDYSGAYEDMIKAGARLAEGVTPELLSELKELSGNSSC